MHNIIEVIRVYKSLRGHTLKTKLYFWSIWEINNLIQIEIEIGMISKFTE